MRKQRRGSKKDSQTQESESMDEPGLFTRKPRRKPGQYTRMHC